MTDQELDRLLRRAMIDSLKSEEESREDVPEFRASPGHRRQMRAMVSSPLRWLRNRERPMWQRAARAAAVLVLVLATALGGIMALSPTARATMTKWVRVQYDNVVTYIYESGAVKNSPSMKCDIDASALPEGYYAADRQFLAGVMCVTYKNSEGNEFLFECRRIQDGQSSSFGLNEGDEVIEVTVGGKSGVLIRYDKSPTNILVWIDPERDMLFRISGPFDLEQLMKMAENVYIYGKKKI